MPANKNALIRYKTIDNCLRNPFRRWTIDDLVDACSDALYEFEGIRKGVSLRTVQLDIQMMRSNKLGYNAPIEVYDHKYYRYSDPDFSITNLPLSRHDYDTLTEAVNLLRQFQDFDHFAEMADVVGRLQDQLAVADGSRTPIVDFERNSNLTGLKFLQPLYTYTARRQCIHIFYQPYGSETPRDFLVFPHLLKEYRNRWFIFCTRLSDRKLFNLALDRIQRIEAAPDETPPKGNLFDAATFFNDVVGVTKNHKTPLATVRFQANAAHAPYIETKPLHASQMVVERKEEEGSVVFQIEVVLNAELYAQLLSFGPGVRVLSPKNAVRKMRMMLQDAARQYPAFE